MNATTLQDIKSGRARIVFQGSVPAINEPFKNLVSYIQDWGNNSFANSTGILKNINRNIRIMNIDINVTPISVTIRQNGNISNAYYTQVPNLSPFHGNEVGRNQQYEDAYNYTKQIMNNPETMGNLKKLIGHSLGGGTVIDNASRLGLEAVAIDPAPVNNPGKYVDDGKIWTYIPNYGHATLNQTIIKNGRKTYRFAPLGLPNLGIGKDTEGIAVYDKIGADGNNTHEPNYNDIKKKESEIESFMMPLGPVR